MKILVDDSILSKITQFVYFFYKKNGDIFEKQEDDENTKFPQFVCDDNSTPESLSLHDLLTNPLLCLSPFYQENDKNDKNDNAEIKKWFDYLETKFLPLYHDQDQSKLKKILFPLNKTFLSCTYLVNDKLSLADLILFVPLRSLILEWPEKERLILCNIVRWFDNLQRCENQQFPLVNINPDLKPPKTQKAPQKAPQKKKPKDNKDCAPQSETPIDISRCDIKVGKILEAKKHPDADGLYIETIDVGEPEPRTVVSGLVRFVPLEEMQNRLILTICNLKPAKMRGIMSYAMVLCASNEDKTKVEFIEPPEGSLPGERISVDGYSGEPDKQLNPRKKIWEKCQVDLKTNENREACFKHIPIQTTKGKCLAKSICNGTIS